MPAEGEVRPLGIVAGRGRLPIDLARHKRARAEPYFVIALEGHADRGGVTGHPHAWFRLGQAGAAIARLRAEGVRDLCLAGGVRRPSLLELRPDARTLAFFARLGPRALGDDGLLKAVRSALEEEGFRLVGAQDVLPDTIGGLGPQGTIPLDSSLESDVDRALEVARALGARDVGQAVVVQQGIVLAVEAIEGTDAMLERAAGLRREGPGGVLVKRAKPGQDRALDLPTIGPRTVDGAQAAGLRAVVYEAGSTLLVDPAITIEKADAAGIALVGVEGPP